MCSYSGLSREELERLSSLDFSRILAVTNRKLSDRPYLEQITRICSAHPRALILREKDLPLEEYIHLARQVQAICQSYGVTFLPHFYPEAARTLEVSHIHLPLWKFRELSTEEFSLVGISVHSVEEAIAAQQLGASYLTAGHIYATKCKEGLAPRGLSFLQEICRAVSIPVYGIGGIHLNAEQIHKVLSQGARGVCIMSSLMHL